MIRGQFSHEVTGKSLFVVVGGGGRPRHFQGLEFAATYVGPDRGYLLSQAPGNLGVAAPFVAKFCLCIEFITLVSEFFGTIPRGRGRHLSRVFCATH